MTDYKLALSPNSPFVTTEATTHFVLRPMNYVVEVIDQIEEVTWMALRVEESWTDEDGEARVTYDQEVIGPKRGTVSWSVTWRTEGTWHILATVTRTQEMHLATMEVLARDKIIARSHAWPKVYADPHATADWAGQQLSAELSLTEKRLTEGTMNDAVFRRSAKETQDLTAYLRGLERLLYGVPEKDLSYARGTWTPKIIDDASQGSQDIVQVHAFLYKFEHPAGHQWVLVDWTNPTCPQGLAIHHGRGVSDAAAIVHALDTWAENSQYPSGILTLEIDGMAGYHLVRARDNGNARKLTLQTTENTALALSEIMGWVSIGAFVLGVIAVVTGIGAAATPALFVISQAAGATSGAAHMIYLVNTGSENWRTFTLDALSITGNLFGLRGSMFQYFGTAPIRIGTAKTTNVALWGEIGVNTVELIFVAESAHDRIGNILDDHSLTPREQLQQGTTAAAEAIVAAGLLGWGIYLGNVEIKHLQRFLESADKPPPGWVGHADEADDPGGTLDAKVHSKPHVPVQSLLFGDFRGLFIAAKYAEENTHPPGRLPTAIPSPPDGWRPGTHWLHMVSRSRRRATVSGALELADGVYMPGRSDGPTSARIRSAEKAPGAGDIDTLYSHVRSRDLREALAAVAPPRGKGHGSCAEVFALDDAISVVGVDGLRGALWDARVVYVARDDLDNGSAVPACRSCQHVFQRFGVIDVNSLRRGSRSKVTSRDLRVYLRACGFPRPWVRTNEALALLREYRIPVSPAAQEIIRLYGGFSTYHSGGPEGCVLFTIDPVRAVGKGVSAVEEVHGVTGLCPIGIDYEGLGLMCIGPDNTIYFQAGPYFKGTTVDDVVERLLIGEPDGDNIAPGDIPLQDM